MLEPLGGSATGAFTFQEWITHVFDHPVNEDISWWHDLDADWEEIWSENANPALTLSFLTRLFEEPGFLIERFTAGQIDQGLYYLVDNSCSEHMFALRDSELPWEVRCKCIAAMASLYEKLLAPLNGNSLGHTATRHDPDHPNFACHMWWDVIPLYGGLDHPDRGGINQAVLEVFEKTLKLKSEACLESVLHGLGHWHLYLPEKTGPIVRRFLAERKDISPTLRRYAEDAATGMVQ